MKQIAILGYGREGKAVLKFLKKSSDYKDLHIEVRDKIISKNYLKGLNKFDTIYRSPGIPYMLLEIQQAKRAGVYPPKFSKGKLRRVKISSATELFFENCPCPIIGITGTKGKSTTSTLIYKILYNSGRDVYPPKFFGKKLGRVYLAGNIGKPAIEILPKLKHNSIVVFELSSFQLQGLQYSPKIAVVLGLFPDHLDSHKNFKEYADAKANITRWQKKSDVAFYINNNRYAKAIASKSIGKKLSVDHNTPYSRELENKIRNLIRLPGEHQLKNAIVAAVVTKYLGATDETIYNTIAKFKGLPHRLQLVRNIKVKPNNISSNVLENMRTNMFINFFNDSASTNPQTTVAAIKAFTNPIILIAGGKDKNLDFKPLRNALKHSNVKAIVLYGENKNKIKNVLTNNLQPTTNNKIPIRLTKKLKDAVNIAYCIALKLDTVVGCGLSVVGYTILLSPASASFDQFKNYKERGDYFKKIVKNLK
ncbi:MAG: UDP-N-acetylmuramoyl-L-alanine--D-glutamate ligase [bacterium]|nr:UDP-N-acetylmuramoyl-L-alanine--D-glutamate ligase [bacterium]